MYCRFVVEDDTSSFTWQLCLHFVVLTFQTTIIDSIYLASTPTPVPTNIAGANQHRGVPTRVQGLVNCNSEYTEAIDTLHWLTT
mmetsp:Transcript_5541/g.8602  ORF Transcript_5541/g.8602 Transcript_5541/m.8602 type:complete len:84 (-) Transcript_5541:2314-2565(-)